MKENLHLFTELTDNVFESLKEGEYQVKDVHDNFFTAFFDLETFLVFDFALKTTYLISPTHVLDLSKLTTKERAMECCADVCEIIEESAEENDNEVSDEALKIMNSKIQRRLSEL